jgi:hypothetical protein
MNLSPEILRGRKEKKIRRNSCYKVDLHRVPIQNNKISQTGPIQRSPASLLALITYKSNTCELISMQNPM